MKKFILLLLLFSITAFSQEIIEISVKGISDSKNEGAQKDRKEAIMDAKRQACEKAGVEIKSKSTVENFQTVFDLIESKSAAVLLPGFQIIDIGYVADGTYQVVLTGKIKVIEEEEISAKELRYAKSLYDREKYSECRRILEKYIENKDQNAPEALQEEALYLYIKWGFSYNASEDCQKYIAYYPDSDKVQRLTAFADFASSPIIKYNKDFSIDHSQWVENENEIKSNIFSKSNVVLKDSVVFEDFLKNTVTIHISFTVMQNNETNPKKSSAYRLLLQYSMSNKPQDNKDIIDDKQSLFSDTGSKTFQHSASGKWFEKFELKNYQIKGMTPRADGEYSYNLRFNISQNGF